MRSTTLVATSAFILLSCCASAQSPSGAHVKVGLSQGDEFGVYGGLDYKLPSLPFRLDADVYSAFNDFPDRSSGVELTVNYIKPIRDFYFGLGVGYVNGRERDDSFDSFGSKFIVGGKIPGTSLGIEGSLLWAQHSIGSIHTVGTISVVYKL